MKKSELKAKIKEMIVAEIALDIDNMEDAPESEVDFLAELEGMLDEADETEKDTAEDVTIDDTETIDTETTTEVDPNVKAVQDALTQAQAAAQKLGDPKLTDQIGNTITFFTRAHVVEKGAVAEADEMEEGKKEDLNEANSLEKNLIINITKYLKKRNPTFPEDIIIKKVSSWLNQGKNLMTATNAMGDDFKKDVLNPIESSLTESKSEDKVINESMFPMLKKILK